MGKTPPHPASHGKESLPMQTNNTAYELVSKRRDACHVTRIWRKVIIEPQTEPSYIPDPTLERKRQELESLNEQIEAMTFNPIYRPPWGVGFTTQELVSIARHEGKNPYVYDWWDALDSVVIKEAREGAFKRAGLPGITELKNQQARLRKEIAWIEEE
jgi:hypothetical protein